MPKEVMVVALRRWGASARLGNRALTTCRAVVLPRFGGPEVASSACASADYGECMWWLCHSFLECASEFLLWVRFGFFCGECCI